MSDLQFAHNRKLTFSDIQLNIILINPENRGNIGSIARIMKNFGFKSLILVNPLENHLDTYAMGFACKAKDVLLDAEVIKCEFDAQNSRIKSLFSQYDVIIGTSAKGYSYQNIKRIPIFLHEFNFSQITQKTKIALVFGRESTGLTNEQIILTDFILKIAASPHYPTLNISQAVGIILYEFYKNLHNIEYEQIIPASKEKKNSLLMLIEEVVELTPIPQYRNDRTTDTFRNIIGRSFSSQKEIAYLYTFFKKLKIAINNPSFFLDRI